MTLPPDPPPAGERQIVVTKNTAGATWWRWVAANALGELVGLGGVFLCGFALIAAVGEPRGAATILLFAGVTIALGAFEGAVVGYAQWRVLRDLLPALGAAAWTGATVLGAVVAWLLGMIPSTVASLGESAGGPPPAEPPAAVVMLLAVGMGAVGGLVLSFAQWRVLRRHGPGALGWLAANAAAWAVAMPWIFWLVGATVAEPRDTTGVLLFLAGIGVSGAIVGGVHGLYLVRRLAPRWREARATARSEAPRTHGLTRDDGSRDAPTTPLSPRALVREWVAAFNRADADALAAFYAEDAVNHQVAEEPVVGREAIRAMFAAGFAAAEMVCLVENLFEEGEWAMLEWRDPLGLRGSGFFHVVDGRIVFQRGYWDKLSFLRQQGLPLPPEP